jgi:hypothetical protein
MSNFVVRLDGNKSAENVRRALKAADLRYSLALDSDVDRIEGSRTPMADEQFINVQSEQREWVEHCLKGEGARIIHEWTPQVTRRRAE